MQDMQIAKLRTDGYPAEFLQFVHNSLNRRFFPLWSNSAVRDLVLNMNAGYMRDGIPTASRRMMKLKHVPRSRTFAVAVAVPTLTAVLAVVALFGITDRTIYMPLYVWLTVIIISGFALAVILTLLLVRQMLI